MQEPIKVDTAVDPEKLGKLFIEAKCVGIANLIANISLGWATKISSVDIPDPEDLLYDVTDAVMKGFGVTASFATRAQTSKLLFGESKMPNGYEPMSGLEIGPFWAADGRRVEATPLQWLDMLYRVKEKISPAALKKVDDFCYARTGRRIG
jgi:hypothetical protein